VSSGGGFVRQLKIKSQLGIGVGPYGPQRQRTGLKWGGFRHGLGCYRSRMGTGRSDCVYGKWAESSGTACKLSAPRGRANYRVKGGFYK